jgi:hypothetical protein
MKQLFNSNEDQMRVINSLNRLEHYIQMRKDFGILESDQYINEVS